MDEKLFLGDIEPRIRNVSVHNTSRTEINLSWIVDTPGIDTIISMVPETIPSLVILYESTNTATLESLVPGLVYKIFLKPISDDIALDPDTIVLEVSTFPPFAKIEIQNVDAQRINGPVPLFSYGVCTKMVISISPITDGLTVKSITLDPINDDSWEFSPLQPDTDYKLTLEVFGKDHRKSTRSIETVHTPCADTFFVKKFVEDDGSVKMTFGTVGTCDAIVFAIVHPNGDIIANRKVPFQKELIMSFSEELIGGTFRTAVTGEVASGQSDYAINKVGFFYEVNFEPSIDLQSLTVTSLRYSNGLISEYDLVSELSDNSRTIIDVRCAIGTSCTIVGLQERDEIRLTLTPFYDELSGHQFKAVFVMPNNSLEFGHLYIAQIERSGGEPLERQIRAQFGVEGKVDEVVAVFVPELPSNFQS